MSDTAQPRWPRPVPTIGDATSASTRREAPDGWAFGAEDIETLRQVIDARRDIRRYRPDPVPADLVEKVIEAGHHGPSVGHSQPWRFIVISDPAIRDRAAAMADRARLQQAAGFSADRAARLMDLKLEGLREAPLGVVVACDRRVPASGVLGRATFPDADMWSCAAAIENMWLTARAHGLGMGWVTLFEPTELADLLGLPDGVETLGWLCLGWPDERPPSPGLQRAAWSSRLPLQEVILHDRWPSEEAAPQVPTSHLAAPDGDTLVGATDGADELLSPPESLGLLDRVLNRVSAVAGPEVDGGAWVLVGTDHPVTAHRVSSFPVSSGRDVMEAAVVGTSVGAAAARSVGLTTLVVDAGVQPTPLPGALDARPAGARGDLVHTDAMTRDDVTTLLERGRDIGARAATHGLVALGEVGIGNTTVAAALSAAALDLEPATAVGLGSSSDADMLAAKTEVVQRAVARWRAGYEVDDTLGLLASLGGPEITVLTGVVLGAATARAPVILDGLAASVPALMAARLEPAVQAYLVAGQVSREAAHRHVLTELGLEPLLALRMRAGEGVGACLASAMILQGLQIRRLAARTTERD